MSNCQKTIESFLYIYPIEESRRSALINKTDELGRSALFYSCYHGNYEAISLLLAAGTDACLADSSFLTPLHYLSRTDDPRTVDLLFLYNKETTKVKLSSTDEVDIGELAKAEMSEDEDEVIQLGKVNPQQEGEDEDLDFYSTKTEDKRIDLVLSDMEKFRKLFGDEGDMESVKNVERNFLLNFQDTLGRTALHYA
jgi:ankyrin repeat protein